MRILKLYIENFKGVKNSKEIDLSQPLVILRGPNGFGKTTIFDAIELCLTGSIKRIVDKAKVTNDTKDYSDAFYRNTANKDVTLKLLIENERKERVTIVKHLPFNHDGNFYGLESRAKKYKVIDSLEKLPTYVLGEEEFGSTDFYELHSPEENYSQKIQEIIFGDNATLRVKDIYKLFGYIQQEENTFYLDLSETKRRDELDFLYNSQDQSAEVEELGKNLEQLKKAETALKQELESLSSGQKAVVKDGLKFERVFDYISFEFDNEDPFAKEGSRTIDARYESTLDYVNRIKRFTEVFDIETHQSNTRKRTLNSLGKNQNFQDFFIMKNFLDGDAYKRITEEYSLLSWLNETSIGQYYTLQKFLNDTTFNNIRKRVSSYVIARKYNESNIVTSESKLNAILQIKDQSLVTEEQVATGASLFSRLQQSKKMADETSKMVASMNELRQRLTELFEESNKHSHKNNSTCPYCGHDWEKYESLKESIAKKDAELEKLSKEQANEISKIIKEIDKDFLAPLEKHFSEFMAHNESGYIFFKKLDSLKGSVSEGDFKTFANKLEAVIGDAKDSIWNEIKSRDKLELEEELLRAKVNKLIAYDDKIVERLQELKGFNFENAINFVGTPLTAEFAWEKLGNYEKLISDREKLGSTLLSNASDIEIDQEKLGGSDANFFKDIFLEKADNIVQVTPKLKPKINYIEFMYSQKKNALHELLDGRRKKIKAVRMKLEVLRNSYRATINDYKNTMTDAVKIPFHVYSARILQNYSQGYGAFIDTPSQSTSSIRFSAGSGSDHDLVHQLSSGQLAVVSMAFSLAINKVYGSASLRFLAIDDPVQELDALNVYSLVELLRSDFGNNYQILLSTHDELHADYMAYKFALDDKDVKSIKVQELFFPITKPMKA